MSSMYMAAPQQIGTSSKLSGPVNIVFSRCSFTHRGSSTSNPLIVGLTACSMIHLRNQDHDPHLSQHLIPNLSPMTLCSESWHSRISARSYPICTALCPHLRESRTPTKIRLVRQWPGLARLPCLGGSQFYPCVGESKLPRANNITHMLLCSVMQLLQHFFMDVPFSSLMIHLVPAQCKARDLDRVVGVRPDVFTDNEPGNAKQVDTEGKERSTVSIT